MTKILKGSTCQPEEINETQPAERLQEFRTREFWNKPPLERSRIAAEWLKKRMTNYHVTTEQVAMYTRMDLPRLQAILDGCVVMGLGEFCDIFHAIPDADESHISSDSLYHHRMYGSLKKIIWLQDGWNGEGSKGMPERLVRRFLIPTSKTGNSQSPTMESSKCNEVKTHYCFPGTRFTPSRRDMTSTCPSPKKISLVYWNFTVFTNT